MPTAAYEVNFDGIVGPTHNYSGLSYGNEASMDNQFEVSNPRQAALQGLAKMKFLMDLGLKQAVLPPHERPHIPTLQNLGFTGTTNAILEEVRRRAPWALRYASSAAPMWAANTATVSPSIDNVSQKVEITPANLVSKLHRTIEAETSYKILASIFKNPIFFNVNRPLLSHPILGDEGSANHIRFAKSHDLPGVHLFVYGNSKISDDEVVPQFYPARQSLQASYAVAKKHQIFDKQLVFAQQNPAAIDAGVFHNDVISTGNLNLFMYHEEAFFDTPKVIETLKSKVQALCDTDLILLPVTKENVTLKEAVQTYLFNSQIVTLPDGSMTLLAPSDCIKVKRVFDYIQQIVENPDTPIASVHYLELHQSMQNGGGPACLRCKMVLNENEIQEMNQAVFLTEELYKRLVVWIKKHYRDKLTPSDLSDPELYNEGRTALDELTQMLELGSIYSFQS